MDNLEKLKRIKKVEAPPFLFTRIRERIASVENVAPVRWKWAFAVTALVVIALNTTAILEKIKPEADSNANIEPLIQGMHLSSSNNLYDE